MQDHPAEQHQCQQVECTSATAFGSCCNDDLIEWLYRDQQFPDGAFLLTGTGIVPPDEFTLENGDVVSINITGIGTLTNPVIKGQ